MPLISRLFIKAGMIFFALSLMLGMLIEIDIGAFPAATPLFWHMLMVGWITQIIFGVSIWMFPGRNRAEGFKPQKWGWFTFMFLNTGLILRLVTEPFAAVYAAGIWKIMLVLSSLLQIAAAATYLIEMWTRVKSKEDIIRDRKQKYNT